MPAESPFARDFGYLEPFLKKVQAHAAQLQDPADRDRLTRLMTEEIARWAEIRALLESSPASGTQASAAAQDDKAQGKPASRPSQPDPQPAKKRPAHAAKTSRNWTIGSLLQRSKTNPS